MVVPTNLELMGRDSPYILPSKIFLVFLNHTHKGKLQEQFNAQEFVKIKSWLLLIIEYTSIKVP